MESAVTAVGLLPLLQTLHRFVVTVCIKMWKSIHQFAHLNLNSSHVSRFTVHTRSRQHSCHNFNSFNSTSNSELSSRGNGTDCLHIEVCALGLSWKKYINKHLQSPKEELQSYHKVNYSQNFVHPCSKESGLTCVKPVMLNCDLNYLLNF